MVSKGNHSQMAQQFRLVNYYNLPRIMRFRPRPSNDTYIIIYLSIDFFCSCCGFSLVRKKLLVCRKNAQGGSFLPHFHLCYSFWICGYCTFLWIFAFFLRKFSLELVTSVASKRTNPVFSRAGVAKRKQVELRKIARIRNLRYELAKG